MLSLLGLLVIVVGLALRLNTLLVVLVATATTGVLAGITPAELVRLLGQLFVDNRSMTLPLVLLLPLIGLLEKHGLQERAAALIAKTGRATAGRICFAYQAMR